MIWIGIAIGVAVTTAVAIIFSVIRRPKIYGTLQLFYEEDDTYVGVKFDRPIDDVKIGEIIGMRKINSQK